MFAVIETGGKQYKVQYGDVIYVEKLNVADNDTVEFPVVAVFGEEGTKFTYKPKKNSKRKMGHRQPYTKVQIEAVKA